MKTAITAAVAAVFSASMHASAPAVAGPDHKPQHSPGIVKARQAPPPAPQPERWAVLGAALTLLGAVARRQLVKK
jgi:hypothetical protein